MQPRLWPLPHPSLRLKLTLAFATAMALLLTALGLFAYARFEEGLDQSINQGLRSRSNDVRALVNQADTGLADAGGARLAQTGAGFAQVLKANGGVLDQTPGLTRTSILGAQDITRARQRPLLMTTQVRGLAGPVRVFATPVRAQDLSLIVVVAASLQNRAAALDNLGSLMLLGGPIALALASLLGYGISALSLRSVESMRQRATRLSLSNPGGRLPVPASRDELQRLALTLNEMLERNDRTFARERRFVADASHELRSPLSMLKMELEDALHGDQSTHALRSALISADAETDRIAHLATDLLTLAQADHGKLPIERNPVSVTDLLKSIQQRFAQRATSQGRKILVSLPHEMVLLADRLRIEQALSNLVDNALRHGAGAVVLSAERRNGCIDLRVADGGLGFPEEFLHVAFERFSRRDIGRTTEGAGLGLSIVWSIAYAHGGEAYVTNRPEGGADAWVSVPETRFGEAGRPPENTDANLAADWSK